MASETMMDTGEGPGDQGDPMDTGTPRGPKTSNIAGVGADEATIVAAMLEKNKWLDLTGINNEWKQTRMREDAIKVWKDAFVKLCEQVMAARGEIPVHLLVEDRYPLLVTLLDKQGHLIAVKWKYLSEHYPELRKAFLHGINDVEQEEKAWYEDVPWSMRPLYDLIPEMKLPTMDEALLKHKFLITKRDSIWYPLQCVTPFEDHSEDLRHVVAYRFCILPKREKLGFKWQVREMRVKKRSKVFGMYLMDDTSWGYRDDTEFFTAVDDEGLWKLLLYKVPCTELRNRMPLREDGETIVLWDKKRNLVWAWQANPLISLDRVLGPLRATPRPRMNAVHKPQ